VNEEALAHWAVGGGGLSRQIKKKYELTAIFFFGIPRGKNDK